MELIFLTSNIPMEWGQIILKHTLKTKKLLPAFSDKFLGEMSVPLFRKFKDAQFLKLITIKLMQMGVKCQTKLTWYNIPTCWAPPAWTEDSKLSVRSCRPITSSSLRFSSFESSCTFNSPVKICRISRSLSDSNHSPYSSLSFLAASGCSLWYLQNMCKYKFTTQHYQHFTTSFSL